jgi:hypothetical protein
MSNQIEAIKLAVEWFDWLNESESIESPVHATTVHKVLKKALEQAITMAEQAQQKPFGFVKPGEGDYEKVFSWNRNERTGYTQEVYTTPPAPAEPDPDELTIAYMSGLYEGKKRKPWVNLTVDELIDLEHKHRKHEDLVQAIEAKLKEKNTKGGAA